MEIGHSPGNPAWTLVERIVSILAPAGCETLWINVSSGLFTAIAILLTSRIAFATVSYSLSRALPTLSTKRRSICSAIAAAVGAMSLAWCDSVWFSAVEAEVYAMSLMLSALSVWTIVVWAKIPRNSADSIARANRWLILSAYIIGFSIGVHQLNLLVIPALALLMAYKLNPQRHRLLKFLSALAVGCVIIVMLLVGMMPGTIMNACDFEILFVNKFGLPYNSGVCAYLVSLFIMSLATVILLRIQHRNRAVRIVTAVSLTTLLYLSGVFSFVHNPLLNIAVCIVVAFSSTLAAGINRSTLLTSTWMLIMVLIGFSVYLIIPIRSSAMPPMNESTPATPFDFHVYLQREQYGPGNSLLKGPTPYSRPLFIEDFKNDTTPVYNRFALKALHPVYRKSVPGMIPNNLSRELTGKDSAEFKRLQNRGTDAWLLTDYTFKTVDIPELDAWFSRLTGRQPDDIESYGAWTGMNSTTMVSVDISEALDSLGNPVGKIGADGKRHKGKALRPAWHHHLAMLLGYQTGYMYLRYLLWNFSGRQNDIPSTGEIDHGNFITGFPIIDNAMLGPQQSLPADHHSENRGYNRYFMLPLLLGLIGAFWMSACNRNVRRIDTVILMLFLLTGVAIVVYLNQNTGEARERDYSFLGSYMAFSLWISAGCAAVFVGIRKLAMRFKLTDKRLFVIALCAELTCTAIPVLMIAQNYDDHDRSRRTAASDFACNILNSLDKNAIVIVDGDNLTFPLWYAQEVLGVRRDVRVVSATYLTQPQYVAQLMIPQWDSPAVEFTAEPYQILSGRFGNVPYRKDESLKPEDAVTALRKLYNDPSVHASFQTSHLIVPGYSPEEFTVKLRETASGNGYIRRRALMLLDMFVTNMASENPRPIYILTPLNKSYYAGFHSLSVPGLYAYQLPPSPTSAHRDSVDMAYLKKLKFGGFELSNPPYVDLTVYREAAIQRSALLMLAKRRLHAGDKQNAYRIATMALKNIPASSAPFRTPANMGEAFQELFEAAEILHASAADDNQRVQALELLKSELQRSKQYLRFVNSMKESRRNAISRSTRSTAAQTKRIQHLTDSLSNL